MAFSSIFSKSVYVSMSRSTYLAVIDIICSSDLSKFMILFGEGLSTAEKILGAISMISLRV